MNKVIALIIGLLFAGFASQSGAETFNYTPLNRTLGRVVNAQGRVDYEAVKTDADLRAFVDQLAQISPNTHPALFPSRADSLAFWINAYNACVLAGVAKAYPISSVTEIAPAFGFFKKYRFVVGGRRFTLDQIEHEIIRPQFADPRIHAAINCAAVSCPRLLNKVFTPDELDDQLNAVMRDMIRNPMHVQIDRQTGVVSLSAIFDWFSSDFTSYVQAHEVGETVLDYISLFLSKDDTLYLQNHPDLQIVFLDYDWSLNSQEK
ncbi:MAG: DUF547 domain-containing protein [Gemmatimonadetes bacterium]|nr:DUF547 domain-containing protein [Gemmatimonadota bacterium]MYD61244.1 DUF547 domain-containing protein [Gemmatimonadota bacterium]MYF74319.1 DUF547 domain-containing protein [Gemmatimonadota bacterium]MYK52906.1 DUF547 domain-containing protein [Gemmatimonadota bacterium]